MAKGRGQPAAFKIKTLGKAVLKANKGEKQHDGGATFGGPVRPQRTKVVR